MPDRQMFLFLETSTDPTLDRVVTDCDGIETLLVWAPDATSAATVADREAATGLGIVELYRGFDVSGAAAVTEAVGDRAAVGVAVYPHGVRPPERITHSVTIFKAETDSIEPIARRHPGGGSTVVVGAADPATSVALARGFADDGVDLVEICGGEPLATTARVLDALSDRVAISYVVYPFDSLERAAAYKASFAPAD
jgi:hypothetical protein